ncbi:SoxR reducing system RseC family protein [Alishewanella sp. SMS9]|nr:SoxR reducing system RseC family protein [Alishewanella sp. SMS9]
MVEEIATVLAIESDGVWLNTTPAGTCHSCHVSTDCGTGIVAQTFTPRQNRFFVKTPLQLLPGEQVTIGVAEQGLVLAALAVYLLHLVLMLVVVVTMQSLWQPAEGWLMLGALIGGASGFALARRYNQSLQSQQEQVIILNVLPSIKLNPAATDA